MTRESGWTMKARLISEVKAVTFDDFFTLRHPIGQGDDIIYPILKALKNEGVHVDDDKFLKQYSREDERYRKALKETLRESLLDDLVMNALTTCGYESRNTSETVKEAVDYGIATQKARWFPNSKNTLLLVRKKGYKLGLVSNTHWRVSRSLRQEFRKFFQVVTLSYEHGYAKPHPSIFIATLTKLGTKASQCLHVGDDPVADIQGAKSVGMKTAFIKRKEVEADADIQIKRLIELTTIL